MKRRLFAVAVGAVLTLVGVCFAQQSVPGVPGAYPSAAATNPPGSQPSLPSLGGEPPRTIPETMERMKQLQDEMKGAMSKPFEEAQQRQATQEELVRQQWKIQSELEAGKTVVLPQQIPFTVTPQVANVRSSPSTSAEVVGKVSRGDVVVVSQMQKVGKKKWGRVSGRNITDGWIALDLAEPGVLDLR